MSITLMHTLSQPRAPHDPQKEKEEQGMMPWLGLLPPHGPCLKPLTSKVAASSKQQGKDVPKSPRS